MKKQSEYRTGRAFADKAGNTIKTNKAIYGVLRKVFPKATKKQLDTFLSLRIAIH